MEASSVYNSAACLRGSVYVCVCVCVCVCVRVCVRACVCVCNPNIFSLAPFARIFMDFLNVCVLSVYCGLSISPYHIKVKKGELH